jgi:hypothetical protein
LEVVHGGVVGLSDVVGFAIEFIRGLYYRELLPDAEPDVDRRSFYLARDVRVLPPGGNPKLAGYHSRFIAWFDRLNDLVHFPSSIEFTKPGDKNAKPLYLNLAEVRERLGVTGGSSAEVMLRAFEKLGYAVQASLAYTRANKAGVYSGEVYALERIMLELEPKESKDLSNVKAAVAQALDALGSYVESPIVIFSGHKSYYIVLELPKPIRAGEYDIRDRLGVVVRKVSLGEVYRAFYELIVRRYLRNDPGITRYLDNQVAEPKRLLRIPGFKHEVSGQPAQLLDTDLHPIDLDPSVMDRAVLAKDALTDVWPFIYQLDTPRSIRTRVFPNNYTTRQGDKWGCLPGWVKELINYLEQTGELCHYARLAVASWMLSCGFTDEEIHEVFSHARNHKPGTTQYHIDDTREYLEGGGRPMRCVTVVEECRGRNIPSIDCKAPPKPATKPEPTAVAPEAKPEEKAEAKPVEARPVEEGRETALNTGRPVQTRLTRFVERSREEEGKAEKKPREETGRTSEPREERLVVIDIPSTLIEDVARELRAPATMAESLVKWVVNYLNRPCCWSVGFERLAIDLSRASNLRFALEALGINSTLDVEVNINDPLFARLLTVVRTVVRALARAGLVEYVEDFEVVNNPSKFIGKNTQ